MAYVLFITSPDAETIDHHEVRRLRKSLQLYAELQSDYVVELDGDGIMRFVSPSFCRAVGAAESELLGRPFLSRLREEDRTDAHAALARARRPPFAGEMRASLAAEPGYLGDVAGRHRGRHGLLGSRPGRPCGRRGPRSGEDRRSGGGTCRRGRRAFRPSPRRHPRAPGRPGRPAIARPLTALARAVAAAAGAECVLYNVLQGDTIEPAVGWLLPPA